MSETTALAQTKRLFKSPQRSWHYIFPDGTKATFINGEYITENENEIAHLESEIKKGHQTIFIDPKEKFVSPDRDDPIASLRKKIAAEQRELILAEMAAATSLQRDLGSSEQGKLNPTSTTDIAPVTAGGDASARLASLRSVAQK